MNTSAASQLPISDAIRCATSSPPPSVLTSKNTFDLASRGARRS
jgi:hypothetical protein